MQNPKIWSEISNHELPPQFAEKLAQDMDRSPEYIARLVQEYLRFVYLTQVSTTEMTPSDSVDRAWHMHLTFTRDYWEILKPKLRRPLHHEPCESPSAMPRYLQQYQDTRVLYAQEFGAPPPAEFWPSPEGDQQIFRKMRRSLWGLTGATAVCFGLAFAFGGTLLWTFAILGALSTGILAYAWFSTAGVADGNGGCGGGGSSGDCGGCSGCGG